MKFRLSNFFAPKCYIIYDETSGAERFLCLKMSWKIRIEASHTGDIGHRQSTGRKMREF